MGNTGVDCGHKHWRVLSVRTRYSRPGNKGDLVETSQQRCKDCEEDFTFDETVQRMLSLCSCGRVTATQNYHIMHEVCAEAAIARGYGSETSNTIAQFTELRPRSRPPLKHSGLGIERSMRPIETRSEPDAAPTTHLTENSALPHKKPRRRAIPKLDENATGVIDTGFLQRNTRPYLLTKVGLAPYVTRFRLNPSSSTMTTLQAAFGVSSVAPAILDSVRSEILRRVYSAHLPICPSVSGLRLQADGSHFAFERAQQCVIAPEYDKKGTART